MPKNLLMLSIKETINRKIREFLDILAYISWDKKSPMRRLLVPLTIISIPLLIAFAIIVLITSIILFTLYLIYLPLNAIIIVIKYVYKIFCSLILSGNWRKTISQIAKLLGHLTLITGLILIGEHIFGTFLHILNYNLPQTETGNFIVISLIFYGILILFVFALVGWTEKDIFKDIDWNEEKKRADLDLDAMKNNNKYHPFFTSAENIGNKKKLNKYFFKYPNVFMSILFAHIIILSSLICQESFYILGENIFTGVDNTKAWGQWLNLILTLLIKLLPFDLADIITIRLSDIKPVGLYGNLVKILIKSSLSLFIIGFIYQQIKVYRKFYERKTEYEIGSHEE